MSIRECGCATGEEYGVTVESICGEYTRVEITLPGDWEETES